MQKQISKSEKEASKISKEIDSYKKKIALIEYRKSKGKGNEMELSNKRNAYQVKQDALIVKLSAVQKSIEKYKSQLTKIR